MVAKRDILVNLKLIDRLFRSTVGRTKEELLYSKMAIIELCGWIEDSMDDVIRKIAQAKLKIPKNIYYINEDIIKKTHSFSYEHFRGMLLNLIGIVNVEKLEVILDPLKFDRMRSTLGNLKKIRDNEAHTHIKKDVTKTLNAPSVTINNFSMVYDGLKDIEDKLKQLRL